MPLFQQYVATTTQHATTAQISISVAEVAY